jgi:hypothetical protein
MFLVDCPCCAQRGLYVYRSDCLRCTGRDIARTPAAERRAAWRAVVTMHRCRPEWLGTLRRLVREEAMADARSGHVRYEGRA